MNGEIPLVIMTCFLLQIHGQAGTSLFIMVSGNILAVIQYNYIMMALNLLIGPSGLRVGAI